MKNTITLIALLITSFLFSQNGINYKAVIKDDLGNVIANQTIDIKLAIKYDGGVEFGIQTAYEELHTINTSSNGIVILNIGEGIPISGNFSHHLFKLELFLNVQIDIEQDGTFKDFGDTYFEYVPKAFYATVAENVKGLVPVDDGNGGGWRLYGYNGSLYGNIGYKSVDLSFGTFSSNILGATGREAFAAGRGTIANSLNSFSIGRYNIGGGSPTDWVVTDPLFEIGNSPNNTQKSNAFTVLKNGKVGIGEARPNSALDVLYNSNTSSSHVHLKESSAGFARLSFSNTNRPTDLWTISGLIGATTANDRLNFYNSDTGDIMSIHGNNQVHIAGSVYVNGGLVHASDRRLKRDIEPLGYGLKEVLQLQPKAYNWKHKETEHKSLGLIAQELELVIKELVIKDSDTKMLSVNYTELIPVLIKALQEQQSIIDAQNEKIDVQALINTQQNASIDTLLQRMNALEIVANQ